MNKHERRNFAHDERVASFAKAMQAELEKEYGEPRPLDKTFMNAPPHVSKSSSRIRFSLIAVAAVMMICVATVTIPLMAGGQAYGGNGILHRLYESVMGIDTDEQDDNHKEEVSTVEITDLKNVDEARDLCENLYVPAYIPQGFVLEKLTVTKTIDFGTDAKYIYKKRDKKLYIDISFMTGSYNSNMKGEVIQMDDRLINSVDGEGVQVFTEKGVITIFGDVSQEETIKIAKKLQQYP